MPSLETVVTRLGIAQIIGHCPLPYADIQVGALPTGGYLLLGSPERIAAYRAAYPTRPKFVLQLDREMERPQERP